MEKEQKMVNVFGENHVLETSTTSPFYWAIKSNETGEIEFSGFGKTESACKAAISRSLKGKDSEGYETAISELEPVGTSEVEPETKPETNNKRTAETALVQAVLFAALQDSSVWSQTGNIIWKNRKMFDGKKVKEMSESFTGLLDKNVDSSLIPETGESRTGEEITLRKKGGKIKWSSWVKTARLVQNCSTIFKALEELGFDTCFVNEQLIPRSQMDKLLKETEDEKPGENPADTVKRCLEMATKKLPSIESKEELVAINEYLAAMLEVYKEQLEVLK